MPELVPKNIVDRTFAATSPGAVPWNVHAEWVVDERVGTGRLVDAAAATMREHPLLSARQGAGEVWVVPDEPAPPAVTVRTVVDDAGVDEVRTRMLSRRFDLRREPPVRFAVVHGPSGDHVLVVADHAVVDGVGIGRTAISLMSAYALGATPGVDGRWRDGHALAATLPSRERIEKVVRELHGRLRPAPVRICPELHDERGGYGVAYVELSAMARQALASLPPGPSTANDLIVAAFCVAGMDWNRRRGKPATPFSVGVPLNLRPARSWFDGVCNATMTWPVHLDEGPAGDVLRQVTEQIRRVRAGIYSVEVRAVLGHLAGRARLSIRDRLALATTTVVSTVPGAEVAREHLPRSLATARLYGGSPAPPAMGITFAVVPDVGTHRLSARFLRSRYSTAGATRLLSAVDALLARQHELFAAERRSAAAP